MNSIIQYKSGIYSISNFIKFTEFYNCYVRIFNIRYCSILIYEYLFQMNYTNKII